MHSLFPYENFAFARAYYTFNYCLKIDKFNALLTLLRNACHGTLERLDKDRSRAWLGVRVPLR
jgi:hypothetical protein